MSLRWAAARALAIWRAGASSSDSGGRRRSTARRVSPQVLHHQMGRPVRRAAGFRNTDDAAMADDVDGARFIEQAGVARTRRVAKL